MLEGGITMTTEEFNSKESALLNRLPQVFRSPVSYYAYEKGHAYGMKEVLLHVESLVNMLEEPCNKIRKSLLHLKKC
jgi:hypothetical protein